MIESPCKKFINMELTPYQWQGSSDSDGQTIPASTPASGIFSIRIPMPGNNAWTKNYSKDATGHRANNLDRQFLRLRPFLWALIP